MKRKLGIFWGLVGAVAVSAMSVSASTFETLPDSGVLSIKNTWK